MAGVTDMPYRVLCREMGCDFSYTEMVSAKGLLYGGEGSRRLLATLRAEYPYGVQIFGREPAVMAEAVRQLCGEYAEGVALIDINMGCPVHKVTANGEGSALMLEMPLAGRIIAAAVKAAAGLPVTVKFRKGYDEDHVNAEPFARMAQESGASMLTVHGRTRAQMYAGKADWDILAAVKAAVDIPVIGNGDVFSGMDALAMRAHTGCDGIMVARGAQGNPFIFQEIKAALAGEAYTRPTDTARLDMAMEHARRLVMAKGERAIPEMRKHVAWYVKGMPHAAELRVRVNQAKSLDEMLCLLTMYKEAL